MQLSSIDDLELLAEPREPLYNTFSNDYETHNYLYRLLGLVESLHEKIEEFEKVKFKPAKPKKIRATIGRCKGTNRSGRQCCGYVCAESPDYCFAHFTIKTNDPRSQYLYSKKIKINN